jgi:helicase-like protein
LPAFIVITRASQVRQAFNSPFWPFVLATTSIGQEGLDFHTYCHAVVHWNLPANPVDLEQREGRVHRYKGHAVRKNLAKRYSLSEVGGLRGDPWEQIFAAGKRDRPAGASDLVPFWVYTTEDGARIERHVPALPLSRDRERIDVLRRSLAAYRMVFGQARQEDLLAYLLSELPEREVSRLSRALRVNLEPPHEGRR